MDPNDLVTIYNYALLMETAKNDFFAAERLYLQALKEREREREREIDELRASETNAMFQTSKEGCC